MENDLKMSEKWTKNANCEQPYCKLKNQPHQENTFLLDIYFFYFFLSFMLLDNVEKDQKLKK